MMPLYKAKTLTGDMLLSPFEIFIYLPEKELEEQQERLSRLWKELTCVSSIFVLQFISKESLIDNDPYLERVFEHSNIFARILMPRNGDKIGIEIGWMDVYASREVFLKGDLLRFIYQLCEKGLEQVRQMKIDTEFFARDSRERDERLFYIAELERRLIEINENIINQEEVDLRLFLADKRRYNIRPNLDYLAEDFEANKHKLGNTDIDSLSIQELAVLVGFDIPNVTSIYDPSVSITVVPLVLGTRLPGLRIEIDGQQLMVPTSNKEGIFAYVCTLIRYKNGKYFRREDINEFRNKLKRYLNSRGWNQKGSIYYEDFQIDEMSPILSREYHWFKKIYKALFYIRRPSDYIRYNDQYDYVTGKTFEQWCIHIIYDNIRDPFIQGISNERSQIRKTLTEQGYGAIVNQVGLLNRDNKFYINVDPDNIKFPPNDELWEEALRYADEINSDFIE